MLRSLLVSREEKTVHIVGRVFKDLEVQFEHYGEAGTQVFIADISDSGAAIHCGDGGLPYSGNLHLDFALPEDTDRIHVTAGLVWQNNTGSAGVRFLDMASYARKKLSRWLKEELS